MNSVTAVERMLADAGFTLIRAKRHPVWRCPCGHTQITSSGTPCAGRGASNCKALMGRILRQCQKNRQATA